MTIPTPQLLSRRLAAAHARRAPNHADERMRVGLVWVAFVVAVTIAARATALHDGIASPFVWPGFIFLGLLTELYLYLRRKSLSDPIRDSLKVAISLGLIGFLALRVLADDSGGVASGPLRMGPPVSVALVCAAQLFLPWRYFLPLLLLVTALASMADGGSNSPQPAFRTIAALILVSSVAVRWMVGRDVARRQDAADREEATQAELVEAVNKLRESELRANRTRALIEQVTAGMPLGVLVHDYETDEIVYNNGRCAEIWRYHQDPNSGDSSGPQLFWDAVQRSAEQLANPQPFLNLHKSLANNRSSELREMELLLKDGRTLRYFSVFIRDEAGREFGRLHAAEDITARKRAEQTEIRYGLAARCANDGLFDWDRVSGLAHYSDRWKEMLGFRGDEIGDSPLEAIRRLHRDDRRRVLRALWEHIEGRTKRFECEFRMRTRSGESVWMLGRGLALRDADDRAYRLAGSLTNITKRKLAEMRLRHDAEHDVLTGLSNRSRFRAILSAHLVAVRSHTVPPFAVLFMDVDRFKLVNDSIGHAAGDELLVALAQMLLEAAPANSEVARLGGDEFALLIPGVRSEEEAIERAVELQQALARPIDLRGQEIVFTASIGIAWGGARHQSPEELLRDADLAMYRAKKQGGATSVLFQHEMHSVALRSLEIQNALQKSIERDELSLVWQPIFACGSLDIIGVEALVRWSSPRLGKLGPNEFIPVAEEIGFIGQLDAWVLEHACGRMRHWRDEGMRPLQLAVNLSAHSLMEPSLSMRVSRTAAEFGLAPGSITVEITETAVIENLERASAALEQLSDLGFRIALDDFGTGYSSLNYIRRLPIDILKIAGSLVDDICRDPRSGAVTRLVIETAHALGLEVITERVESPEQLDFLRRHRCDAAQGFYLSRPVSADDIDRMVNKPASAAKSRRVEGFR